MMSMTLRGVATATAAIALLGTAPANAGPYDNYICQEHALGMSARDIAQELGFPEVEVSAVISARWLSL